MPLKWLEMSVRARLRDMEPLTEVFRRYGFGGVAIDEEIEPFSPDEGETLVRSWDSPIAVRIFIPQDDKAADIRRALEEDLSRLDLEEPWPPLQAREWAEEDWALAWREFFKPLRVTERIVIKPSWESYAPAPGEVVIELDPGIAFGTGQHPTTRMCLQELERCLRPGMRVLDVGAGTGILAIAAAMLGADEVVATDINDAAVEVARANVRSNGVEGTVRVIPGSLPEGEPPFDLVVANISGLVVADLLPQVVARLKDGGVVILSGFIHEWVDEVATRMKERGLRVLRTVGEDDWRTVVGSK